MFLRYSGYIIFCMIAGGAIAAGYVAFITLLGIFDKLAEKLKALKYATKIESLLIAGVTLGNFIYIQKIAIPFSLIGLFIFLLIGGIFTGCLAGALAETLKIFPILSRRLCVREYLPYVLIACALGKFFGCIIQQLYF